jgi:Tol biopolymer transport system component
MARGALAEASEAADEGSFGPSLSADGRIVAFTTRATTYPDPDTFVYVHDRDTGAVEPVPEAAGYPVLSDDGRFVAFVWERRVYAYDRRTGERAALAPEPLGADDTQHEPYLSGDGCWATYLFSQGPVTQVWVARNPLR